MKNPSKDRVQVSGRPHKCWITIMCLVIHHYKYLISKLKICIDRDVRFILIF